MSVHVFGIRHHGPGSARSLRQALEALAPDVLLVEGPPDAEGALPLLTHAQMRPPVALLLYVPDAPHRAVFYPFARFSPEWQALDYGLRRGIPTRFMDLPHAHRFALEPPEEAGDGETEENPSQPTVSDDEAAGTTPHAPDADLRSDPLGLLARAAGDLDGERWWERLVEERQESADLFAAVLEAMTALRQEIPPTEDLMEMRREAFMRQTIRAAIREGFDRIAVVCGAWHAPVLDEMPPAREDAALLKGLPKTRVQATWIPWTHGRLQWASGYGAGIESPGWYDHLFMSAAGAAHAGAQDGAIARSRPIPTPSVKWLAKVARLLREESIDVSSAHLIEAVRLAEALAAVRDRPTVGLAELNEATRAILLFGDDLPMRLIDEKLIVGETLGAVSQETPGVPLQQDLAREQRRLRLPPEAAERLLDLDLRRTIDRERSLLLHRLNLLGVPWGMSEEARGKSGTFHEVWRLRWQPELAVSLIEAGRWGNTIADASAALARDAADRAPDLPALTELANRTLLADLPEAVQYVIARLEAAAAVTADTAHLMAALPPLAHVSRYGSVRGSDAALVAHVVAGLVLRICIGLPGACASLNDDAAREMSTRIVDVHNAIAWLQDAEHGAAWNDTLGRLADLGERAVAPLHGLVAGRSCRLLLDARSMSPDESALRLSRALSLAVDPTAAASWAEGFLSGGGAVLIHDETLWQVVDGWVAGLSTEAFTPLLPCFDVHFSTFTPPERRRLGERVRRGAQAAVLAPTDGGDLDHDRAALVLPMVARLLGVE